MNLVQVSLIRAQPDGIAEKVAWIPARTAIGTVDGDGFTVTTVYAEIVRRPCPRCRRMLNHPSSTRHSDCQ